MKFLSAVITCAVAVAVSVGQLPAQGERKDRGIFVEPKNEFMDSIKKEVGTYNKKPVKPERKWRIDFSSLDLPKATTEFTSYWCTPPISQGESGMCWAFSTISFFESEIHRLAKREIKLSELYTVYWEYVEKARRYVQERGDSEFGQGSEANAVPRIWKLYGTLPAEAYTGMKPHQKFHGHAALFQEMKDYLTSLKTSQAWNEEVAISTIKSILNHYLGEPPTSILVDGMKMTPREYLDKVVKLNLDDYVEFMSLAEKPYYQQVEYEVSDNWWHSQQYYNIPLDEYMMMLKRAIRKGFTMALGGDTSEPGLEGHAGVAVVPSFDIPAAYIDENARQMRFSNSTSTDDHGIHLVGFKETPGGDWYLIKDSGSGSRNNTHPGYYFYHEDYVKLKMLDFMVHKDAAEDILKKFKD
ncbi:MAG TPA: peptidase C1 [Bacteroidetes bacterium]|nr:peptidase C1 [Bacteroidota bacterium]